MNQIESLFTDRERLVKRTTHMRKELPIFGKEVCLIHPEHWLQHADL